LDDAPLLVADYVTVDSQRDSRVGVPQLTLHHSRRRAINEQCARCAVTQGMETATWNFQRIQQRMQFLSENYVGVEEQRC
jgi:hypothetical protein